MSLSWRTAVPCRTFLLQIFKGCEALGGCIIFLDELDSLATSRDQGDMHEASRRLLGVLLREIDGFNHRDTAGSSSDGGGGDSSKRSVVIGATNRQQDLDAALLSRCAGPAAAAGLWLHGMQCWSQNEHGVMCISSQQHTQC